VTKPVVVVAVPLDHLAEDALDGAAAIARGIGAEIVPVHAHRVSEGGLGHVMANGGVGPTLAGMIEPLRKRGLDVRDAIVEEARPEQLVPQVAARLGAALVVVGSGRGSTIRDWLLGTTAERIVRACAAPVWIARGTLPSKDRPVLCPVDLGDESRLAIAAAARWARAFGSGVRVVHVLDEIEPGATDRTLSILEKTERSARERLAQLVASVDAADVAIEVRIERDLGVSAAILREAEDAGAMVLVQPDWEMLVPASLGSRTERWVRRSPISVLAIRDDEVERQRHTREERYRWIATLEREALAALGAGDAARAERLLSNAKIAAPASARIEEALARAIDAQGRTEEADRHRALAAWLRGAFA
jgi:nucleotide-binding universal stress UspA family protein